MDTPARLLLVDDNPANLKVLFDCLQGAGYRFSIANDGDTALQIAHRIRPDLVLLDVNMPGTDGFEVCRRLRSDASTAETAVIFLTARTDPQSKVAGLDLGAVDYITKPINVDEVLARIRTHLTIRQLHRKLAETNRDLEQRVAERTAQLLHADRLATLGGLTAGLLHEVRNPLVTLTGYHRLVQRTIEELQAENPSEQRLKQVGERLATAQKAAEAMVDVVENMLRFARKDGRATAVDVAAVVRDALEMLATLRPRAAVQLTPPPAPAVVTASASELVQVLTNLLTNAADAIEGQPDPAIRLSWQPQPGYVVLELSDNGPGVPEEIREKLFKPFFTTKQGGTGLGLMISRHIIENMGGAISCQQAAGGGASFVVRIPI